MSATCVEAPTAATKMVDWARRYAARYGWACVPVRGKKASSCWERFQQARPSSQQMFGAFRMNGVTGVAVIAGAVSGGLRVRDYDDPDAYGRWADANPDLAAALPTARTARGYHVYFRCPDLPETITRYEDGELRAGRCYVVAPPSEHPAGGQYEWVIPPGGDIPVVTDPAAAGLVGPAPPAAPPPAAVPPAVDAAIGRTLPVRHGQRNDLVFQFARRLKAIPDLDTTYDAMASYIREWHRRALPHIRTKEFRETERTFFNAWDGAETPLADGQFREVVDRAMAAPDPGWYVRLLQPDGARKLLKVCMALQAFHGGGEFFLSARKAAGVINSDPTHANRLLNGLAKAGYLRVIKKGTLADMEGTTWAYTGKEA